LKEQSEEIVENKGRGSRTIVKTNRQNSGTNREKRAESLRSAALAPDGSNEGTDLRPKRKRVDCEPSSDSASQIGHKNAVDS
jgi:hypothetical protein